MNTEIIKIKYIFKLIYKINWILLKKKANYKFKIIMGNIANGCADFKPELINDKNDKF